MNQLLVAECDGALVYKNRQGIAVPLGTDATPLKYVILVINPYRSFSDPNGANVNLHLVTPPWEYTQTIMVG